MKILRARLEGGPLWGLKTCERVQPRPHQPRWQWQKPRSQEPLPVQLFGQKRENGWSHAGPLQPCGRAAGAGQ